MNFRQIKSWSTFNQIEQKESVEWMQPTLFLSPNQHTAYLLYTQMFIVVSICLFWRFPHPVHSVQLFFLYWGKVVDVFLLFGGKWNFPFNSLLDIDIVRPHTRNTIIFGLTCMWCGWGVWMSVQNTFQSRLINTAFLLQSFCTYINFLLHLVHILLNYRFSVLWHTWILNFISIEMFSIRFVHSF